MSITSTIFNKLQNKIIKKFQYSLSDLHINYKFTNKNVWFISKNSILTKTVKVINSFYILHFTFYISNISI